VSASLVVSEILGDRGQSCHRSCRDADKADEAAVWIVAERIAAEVDALAGAAVERSGDSPSAACCSCSKPSPGGVLQIGGTAVAVNGLPLVFEHLRKKGLAPESDCGDALLATVRIYHAIEPGEESAYRDALVAAYRDFCLGARN
jgi:hypothetical protein